MNDYNFKQIKENILKWIQNDISKQLASADSVEIAMNEKDVLIIDFTFKYCFAQIVVNEPTWAPYKYVYFESATEDSREAQKTRRPETLYFFYDTDEMSEKEVMEGLTSCVKRCSAYLPNEDTIKELEGDIIPNVGIGQYLLGMSKKELVDIKQLMSERYRLVILIIAFVATIIHCIKPH